MRFALACFTLFNLNAASAGLLGEFWDVTSDECFADSGFACIGSLTNARLVIDGGPADASFTATTLNYPLDAGTGNLDVINDATLAEYLGPDAASLSGGGDTFMPGSVFRYTGFITLEAGTRVLRMRSDDGSELRLGGQALITLDRTTIGGVSADFESTGDPVAFELIHFNNLGSTPTSQPLGIELLVDGSFVDPGSLSVVPVPAAVWLFGSALLGLAGLRRRA